MTDPYPIIEVEADWAEDTEYMGDDKPKFWFKRPADESDDNVRWLFKYPRRQNSGEHWAEKIAEQVANLLEIPHGEVEFAVFDGARGSASKSFVRDGEELFHGNQILETTEANYDASTRFRQSDHTLDMVLQGLDVIFVSHEAANRAKRQFAEYVMLDALIGNTDRHHRNWGIVRKLEAGEWVGRLAPSYDHASSLGRELRDSARDGHLGNGVERYSKRGRGGIYWNRDDSRAPSPLSLARMATEQYPDIFVPAMRKLDSLSENDLVRVASQVPKDWMSKSATCFAVSVMRYNLAKLREVVIR